MSQALAHHNHPTGNHGDQARLTMDAETLAVLCKAASDPMRLEILRVLSHDSFGVLELAAIFSMPQPGMSHHLKVLSTAKLLVTRRQGNSIFYRRPLLDFKSQLDTFQASLFATVDRLPLLPEYVQKIETIYFERSAQSRLYFERNAARHAENQLLLCELNQYLPNMLELVSLMQLPKAGRILEIGPGEGTLLAELATRFEHIVALDNSEEMLALAQGQVAKKHGNITFVKDSIEAYIPGTRLFNAAALNMVLHHMASPIQIFQKLSHILRPGGYVLIADLCLHNQEWTRISCGDVWLGFEPGDLTLWAEEAGFTEDQSLYLGLKNGFQIQLRLFRLAV